METSSECGKVAGKLRRIFFIAAFAVWMLLSSVNTAPAALSWEGRDWGGVDFTPGNGDILTGTFINIGHFIIDAGSTVYAGSNLLSLSAGDIKVSGTMYGGSTPESSLTLVSNGNMALNNVVLDHWASVYLQSTGSILLNGTITIIDNNGTVTTFGNSSGSIPIPPLVGAGSDFGTRGPSPVPIPPTVWLLGTSLAGLAALRGRFRRKPDACSCAG